MTHYRLDVDPAAVRSASRRLERAGGALEGQAAAVRAAADGWAAGWQGDVATAAEAEVGGLVTLLRRGASALQAGGAALKRLAGAYEHAEEVELPRLERRREQALAAREAAVTAAQRAFSGSVGGVPLELRADAVQDAGVARGRALSAADGARDAAERACDAAFDDLVDDLRERTRATGAVLADDPPVPVPPLALATYQLGMLFGGITLTPLGPAGALAGLLPLGALAARLQHPPSDLPSLEVLLDQARAAGLPPVQFKDALRRLWEGAALEAAGIDPSQWDPSQGAQHNADTIRKVYAYYASLYLHDPDLAWAGMAAAIGPSFAGGFLDLAMLRELADVLPDRVRDALPEDLGSSPTSRRTRSPSTSRHCSTCSARSSTTRLRTTRPTVRAACGRWRRWRRPAS